MQDNIQSDQTQVQSNQSEAQNQEQHEEVVVNRSAEELAKRLKEVSQEAKQHRQRAAEERRKREELEKSKLQEQGQFKELAEIWQRKATDHEQQATKLKEAFALKTIADSVELEAQRLGCVDTSALINLLPLDQVPIDETFSVDRTSVKAMLEDFKKNKPYFFQKQAPKIVDATPAKPEAPGNDLKKLTLAEKAALLSQLKKQGK